jgi:uncharacterized protein (TIGR02391 family)
MSFDQVNKYFLRIGRNRREEKQESQCGRIPTGKKGLGKLALFGIGDQITISTSQKEETVQFDLNWNEILATHDKDYEPTFKKETNTEGDRGTTITLTELRRKTGFPLHDYANNIAKLFNFSDDFVISISLNDEETISINSKTKYTSIEPEFTWNFKDIININSLDYANKYSIHGLIITTEKPLKANLRGVTLFANGRMVNLPEFFGPSESSHFYSYATGWLNIDFIDNWDEDVISTNRQSIDWENPKTTELREYLASCLAIVEKEWRELRKDKKQNSISAKVDINVGQWINKLPKNVQNPVSTIVNLLDDTPEISQSVQQTAIKIIHSLVPEYANLHWRHLHPDVRNAAEPDYVRSDFYRAFIEAVKRYINSVRAKSKSTNASDHGMMGSEFGLDKVLQVAAKYNKPDGSKFHADTYKCIEDGQKYLSMGIVTGARNPISHEEIGDLRDSKLFTEKDCLDMLSLLSHLFRRLDDADEAP